jgi:hypothetical protein
MSGLGYSGFLGFFLEVRPYFLDFPQCSGPSMLDPFLPYLQLLSLFLRLALLFPFLRDMQDLSEFHPFLRRQDERVFVFFRVENRGL